MKTSLLNQISSAEDARVFLRALANNGESFHPDDDARNITAPNNLLLFTPNEASKINELMAQICQIEDFDACDYLQQIELINHMEDFGYKEHCTGGDCRSFMKQINEEFYLLITNEDGLDIPSEATEPANIGMYSLLRDGTLAEFTKISIFDFLEEEDEYIAKLFESAKRMIAVQNEDKRQTDSLLEDIAKMAYYAGEQEIYVSNGILATYEVCISIAKEFHAKHINTNWDEEEIDWDAQAEHFFDAAIEKVQHAKRRTEQTTQKQPEPQVEQVQQVIFFDEQLRIDVIEKKLYEQQYTDDDEQDRARRYSYSIEESTDKQGTKFWILSINDDVLAEQVGEDYIYYDQWIAKEDGDQLGDMLDIQEA